MSVVNEIGVDPNRILDYPHTSGLIQFVCGLGPRKGSALVKVCLKITRVIFVRDFVVVYMGTILVKV